MATRTLTMNDALHQYLIETTVQTSEVMDKLREETATMPNRGMQISPEQGQFMAFLVKTLGVKKALEVGVFTGYSSLVTALALPESGQLIACDISDEFTQVARRYWAEAGVDRKITLHIGPATETLERLQQEGHNGTFDFAFIDADKGGYDAYYEAALKLVRSGGVIAIDNVLWAGKVADPDVTDTDTEAIRILNKKVFSDDRVEACLLPVGDGVTLARVK
ncbi:MAG: class I SAM-dependent methyltransferase [Armatimonadaceae bacterium]